jgi:hypothetical protein
MLVEDFLKIKVNPNSREHYRSIGYDCENYDIIEIKTGDLPSGSNIEVLVRCDICELENRIKYNKYIKNTKYQTIEYTCKKCSIIKSKRTKLEKYGDENYQNIHKIKKTKLERWGDENYTNRLKSKQTCLVKYGVENPSKSDIVKEKRKKTYLEKFGCENVFQSEEVKEKIKKTCLEKFGTEYYIKSSEMREKYNEFCNRIGVDHYSRSKEYREKFEKTCLERWGVKTSLMNPDIKEKIKKTNLVKYGFDHVMKNKEISILNSKSLVENRSDFFKKLGYEYIGYNFDDGLYNLKNLACGHVFDIKYDLFRSRIKYGNDSCLICYPKNELSSIKEKEMVNWLESLNINIDVCNRSLIGKEIDIYLPDHKIGIEFNGLYYHSDKFKEKKYHSEKSEKCRKLNIDLLHIWEDDWVYRKDIVKSIVLNKLNLVENKIFARNCEIKEVDASKSREFLDKNHIQGYTNSSIKIGLYYKDELVSLMTFGNRRINSKNTFELVRFCNKINTNVIGGASKLFKYFLNNYNHDRIVSYSDISLFSGSLYEKLGFKNEGKTSLNYYWTDLNIRYHRFNFNKKKLVEMGYDQNLTEEQIMKGIGYYKIWSCGQIRWSFNKPIYSSHN